MHVVIINGSIRQNNTTRLPAKAALTAAAARGWQAELVGITAFDSLFRGDYVTPEAASDKQRAVLETMAAAEVLLFVVPTYYKGMPGGLKNFFDIVRWPAVYDGKIIGIVQSNHKNQDYAGVQTERVLEGLLTFFDIAAAIIHDIIIVDPNAIDDTKIEHSLDLIERYHKLRTAV